MKEKKITIGGMLPALMAVAALGLPGKAAAENKTLRDDWVDSSVVVWKNPFGQCWQGRDWMPAVNGEDCAADKAPPEPAVRLALVEGAQTTLAMNTAVSFSERSTLYLDSPNPPSRIWTMVPSCFTTHR